MSAILNRIVDIINTDGDEMTDGECLDAIMELIREHKANEPSGTIVQKAHAFLCTRLLYSRKDLRYALNRRHEECRVDWGDTVPARIEDIKMWEFFHRSLGVGWDKYGLQDPEEFSRLYDNGKE